MTPLRSGLDDLKAGAQAAWALSVEAPPADRPVRRFAHGFALTWVLVGIALRDDGLRRGYLRTALPISLLTLALATAVAVSPWSPWRKDREDPERDRVVTPGALPIAVNGQGADDDERDEDGGEDEAAEVASQIKAALAQVADESEAPDASVAADVGSQIKAALAHAADESEAPDASVAADVGSQIKAALARAASEPRAPDASATAADAGAAKPGVIFKLHSPDDDDEAEEPPRHWSWPTLSALYAALAFVERCLLALTRDHQHLLSRRLCLATGATPEDDEVAPRVRFSFRWVVKRLRRKVRGLLIVASIAGVAGLARLLPSPVGEWAAAAVAALWGGYWLCVFALGAADLTWKNGSAEQPFFIRWCERARQVPVLGWLTGIQARVWKRLLRDVRPACMSAELAPWETAGLGLSRLISGLPVINGFVRPAVSVAAQLALRPRLPAAPRA